MKINAVMVAAGKGERMGMDMPKAFLPLAGAPLFIHSLRRLAACAQVGTVVVVVAPEQEDLCRTILAEHAPVGPAVRVVHGGVQRQDSVRLGLAAVDVDCEIVVIHDAARPFVAADIIDRSIAEAGAYGSALVAIPVKDTIKRGKRDGTVSETVPRQDLWLAQTPQTFRLSLIRDAHARALHENVTATDDAALIERIGETVRIVPGDPYNFKITTLDDLQLAEALLRSSGGDSHP